MEYRVLSLYNVGAVLPNCTDGEFRLADGLTERDGRVEICYGGVWGSICNDGWDDRAASVICRQLGFDTECKVLITAHSHALIPAPCPPLIQML